MAAPQWQRVIGRQLQSVKFFACPTAPSSAAVRCVARCPSRRAYFFAAARLAVQQRLGALWNQPAQAITSAEVLSRIPEDSPVARFFREADQYEYNRQHSGEIQPQWRALLDEAMTSLTPSTR
jgi:hypothetical protein